MALTPSFLMARSAATPYDPVNVVETELDCRMHAWYNHGGRITDPEQGGCLLFCYLDTLTPGQEQDVRERFLAAGWDEVRFDPVFTRRRYACATLVELIKLGTVGLVPPQYDLCTHPRHIFRKHKKVHSPCSPPT